MLPIPENLLMPPTSRRTPGAGGWFDLDDWVGPGYPSGRADVAKIEAILANSGDFPIERFQGTTGYWGGALDAGIRAYQKRNGLKVDGTLRPDGPTISHMREDFSSLFDGHEPPTVEDIDAHQNVVGDDNDGTITWRKPPVDLSQVPGLPEIDHEADASNARLVRAMLRTGDIDDYAPLMRDAIDQGGKRAVAEVYDLTRKLDDASPGLGGRFTAAIADGMSKAQRDAAEIKVQGGQPLGTVQVAMLRPDDLGNIGGQLQIGNEGTRGGGGALGGGLSLTAAAKFLAGQFKLPGFTPVDNENKPIQTPPPALLDVPIHTGNPAERLDPPNVLVNVPPISDEERKGIVKGFLDGFVVEYGYADGKDDKRGGPKTVELNNVVARACEKAIGESRFPQLIKQLGGASLKGEEEEYMPERRVGTVDGKYRLPDYLMGKVDKDNKIEHAAAINTVTTRADGSPTQREQNQLDDLIRSKVVRFVDSLGKVDADGDPQDLFDAAYKKCVEGVRRLEAEIEVELEAGKQESKE